MSAPHSGTKAVVAALLANSGIAVVKFAAFLLTGASSLLAESIHSVADSGNQGLLLLGAKRAKREATPEHPFGYGRERYVYAFLVSIVLFSVGGLFALYEAWHKAHEVHAGHSNDLLDSGYGWVALVVLGIGVCLEGASFRTAIIESNKTRGQASWRAFIRRAKHPELPVILLEDAAALLGLVTAFAAISLTLATGNGYYDVAGTGVIGVLLVCVAAILAAETKSLLVGESASPASQRRIADAISATPGIESIIHIRTLHLGPDELLVGVKVAVAASATAATIAQTINAAEAAARAAEPTSLLIYMEPDLFDATREAPDDSEVVMAAEVDA